MKLLERLPIYPYGVKISQTWLQVALHLDAIERFNIAMFIELGVHEGGMASVLIPKSSDTFHYLGIEQNEGAIVDEIRDSGHIIFGDCFDQRHKRFIKKFIHEFTTGPALIFCDNGDKPRELFEYAPLLRPGDYISVHDYGTEIGPDEVSFLDLSSDFEEIEPDERRHQAGMPLWRRL